MKPAARRLAWIALGLALAAAGVGLVSAERVRDQLAVIEACEATGTGDFATTLARTQGRADASETGRAAAECRCLALLATGRGGECSELLARVLADPRARSWAPRPDLSIHLIQTWREEGRAAEAAGLARRAAQLHPDDAQLFGLELATRASVEDESAVLAELGERLARREDPPVALRVALANRWLLRGEPAQALAALGARTPAGGSQDLALWFETRGRAFASQGDLASVQRTYTSWRGSGGDPGELFARYALTLSIAGLKDPERPPLALIREGAAAGERVSDPRLREALAIRLILSLVSAGRREEALAVYDRERLRFPLEGLTRAELERSQGQAQLARSPGAAARSRLRFALAEPRPGTRLRISPEPGAPPDADYPSLAMPERGELAIERAPGSAPLRWVWQDARGSVLGSGTLSPRPGETRRVEIQARAPRAPGRAALTRRPGDGHRQVALLLLDCADWRIVQYLRARGELPVLDALLRSGTRAVLESDPPLTAAALESIVWPDRRSTASFAGIVHQLGTELAGLASIGENPFDALRWVLPEERDFFSVVGAGDLSAANLLFAHGDMQAGRHSEVTGPHGARRQVPLGASARDLSPAERARFPGLAAVRAERDRVHLRTIAAQMDTAEALVRARELDLFALRVEALDILTHAHFADAVQDGQDDGGRLLFDVYRYLDARLADIHAALDADDLLVVMSDHGIRTAMEHDKPAIFVAAGPGVPATRVAGTPSLRGVPHALARLLGVEAPWPDAGLIPATAFASSRMR
ncbi:MAG TPA: alkaline phosphatase family protein [Myxococcota bacterium]